MGSSTRAESHALAHLSRYCHSASHTPDHPGHGQLPRLHAEGDACAVGGQHCRHAEPRQSDWRPHLRISGASVDGGPDFPRPDLDMLGTHTPARTYTSKKRDRSQMTQEIIRFQDVTKRFGALTVLDRFNFSVRT